MTSELLGLCFDAHDPRRLAGFWSRLLVRAQAADPAGGVVVLP